MSLVGINIEEFVKGGCIGLIQTGFGHPLDTMKTLKQYSSVKHKNVITNGFHYERIVFWYELSVDGKCNL